MMRETMARSSMTRTRITLIVITVGGLLLAGCDRTEPQAEPEPTPSPGPTETETPISILREAPAPAASEAPPPRPFEKTISFAQGGSALDEAAHEAIAKIVASDQFQQGGAITVWGHTDSVGGDDANLRASARRAEVVAKALEGQGADPENITIIPLGEMRAIAPNARLDGTPDEEGRARNRRVEVSVAPPSGDVADATSEEASGQAVENRPAEGVAANTPKPE